MTPPSARPTGSAVGWAVIAFVAPAGALVLIVGSAVGLLIAGAEHRAMFPAVLAGALAATPLFAALRRKSAVEPMPAGVDARLLGDVLLPVASEAEALGVSMPAQVRLTLDYRLELRRSRRERTLIVGLPTLAVTPDAALRAWIGAELLADSRTLRRGLAHLWARLLAIDATLRDFAALGRPWRPLVRALTNAVARALEEQDAVVSREIAERHGGSAALNREEVQDRRDSFATYWTTEVLPCLEAGYHPPVVAGWQRFDTPDAAPPFLASDRPDLEAAILRQRPGGGALVPLSWEKVPEVVWIHRLRAEAVRVGALVADHDVGDLGQMRLDEMPASVLSDVSAAVTVALHHEGWTVTADLGDAIGVRRGSLALFPFALIQQLTADAELRSRWHDEAEDLGIAHVDLAVPIQEPPAPEHLGTQDVRLTSGSVQLPLRPSRFVIRRLWRRAAFLCVLAAPVLGFFAWTLTIPDGPAGARVLVGAMVLGMALSLWRYLRRIARLVRVAGTISIDRDTVRITHPALLREPWQLPRYLLRSVAFDDADDRTGRAGERLRFVWSHSPWANPGSGEAGASGSLWSDYGPVIPMVAAPWDRPNLALVFTEPVAGPRVRRTTDESPLPGEAIGGLLLTADPRSAPAATLAKAGLLTALTAEDARVLYEAHSGVPA